MFNVNAVWPNWNWKEIASLVDQIGPEIQGLFVDRIVVPARTDFPLGYLKGEWVIRLTGRKAEKSLLLSVRARHPYFGLYPSKGPAAASEATRSPFDLALSKHLKGLRLISCETLPRERSVLFDFDGDLRLVISLIPATPEALLVKRGATSTSKNAPAGSWPVIARSRTLRGKLDETGFYLPPDGSRAVKEFEIREGLGTPQSALQQIETAIEKESFALRMQEAEKEIRELSKQAQDRIRQSEVAKSEASKEADWQRYGDLLKANMGMLDSSGNSQSEREVIDFETAEKIDIPCDPKLDVRRQVEKFFSLAQRKTRRIAEATHRVQTFSIALARFKKNGDALLGLKAEFDVEEFPDWKTLEAIEKSLSGGITRIVPTGAPPAKEKRKAYAWLGKSFVSKDGWAIWVGRNKDENLELTFKHARGNDMWMHVRGRPGSHVVIPVQPGKSVPLETLLDAATLVVHYSKGENWGKTEVDYTFKKYVKRIKDSSEASYTHNKTLILTPDPVRSKRLLGSES